MTIKLIVGLANPGPEYVATRHNAGSWYVTLLAERYHQSLKKEKKFFGDTSRLTFGHNHVSLLVPSTFMNLSGKAVWAISSFYRFSPEEILVAHDDLDLLPGNTRLKLGGSHGGHKGLKDIMSHLNNAHFYRLRIGIGHPGNTHKVVDFVLGIPPSSESKLIHAAINKAVLVTETLIVENSEKPCVPSPDVSLLPGRSTSSWCSLVNKMIKDNKG